MLKMKFVLKLLIYIVASVLFAIGSALFFRNHPEVQLTFLIPGVFIIFYSKIRDEFFMPSYMRLRIARGR
jgi:hypothetical protein